jgi:hypothetical protein
MKRTVQAVRVADDALPEKPGEFSFRGNRLAIMCPCGCGDIIGISVADSGQGPVWQWDGNKDKPTCSSSIQVIGGCKCHGYLTNGEFVEC